MSGQIDRFHCCEINLHRFERPDILNAPTVGAVKDTPVWRPTGLEVGRIATGQTQVVPPVHVNYPNILPGHPRWGGLLFGFVVVLADGTVSELSPVQRPTRTNTGMIHITNDLGGELRFPVEVVNRPDAEPLTAAIAGLLKGDFRYLWIRAPLGKEAVSDPLLDPWIVRRHDP